LGIAGGGYTVYRKIMDITEQIDEKHRDQQDDT
jgi:hypothetical protein